MTAVDALLGERGGHMCPTVSIRWGTVHHQCIDVDINSCVALEKQQCQGLIIVCSQALRLAVDSTPLLGNASVTYSN